MKLPLIQKAPAAPAPSGRSPLGFLITTGIGLLMGYLMDPEQGKRRRNMLRDRIAGALRQGGASATRGARALSAEASGVKQKVTHVRPVAREYDDVTLARKLESELFRGTEVTSGSVNVNVEDGVAVLRGEVPQPDDIEELEQRARRTPGVVDVRNLLHLPGTPARMS